MLSLQRVSIFIFINPFNVFCTTLNFDTPHFSLSMCCSNALNVVNLILHDSKGQKYIFARCLGLARCWFSEYNV